MLLEICERVSTKQERIAELAKRSPQMAFTSATAYLMDIDWLREACRRTRKDGAVGVDGMTAAEYEQGLEGNLQRLARPARSPGRAHRAPPVRARAHPERRFEYRTAPDRDSPSGGQGPSAGGGHVAGADLRAGLLTARIGFRPGRSAHQGARNPSGPVDGQPGRLDVEVWISGSFLTRLDHC